MLRDDATLLDIGNAARLVQTFIQDMTQEAFLSDLKTQSAVLHQLTVIGEAVKRLSHPFASRILSFRGFDGRDAPSPDSRLRCG
jgi:uncharacterized protein with HEPN domain